MGKKSIKYNLIQKYILIIISKTSLELFKK